MGKNQAHQARKANFNSGGDGDDAGGRDFGDGMVRHGQSQGNRGLAVRVHGQEVHDNREDWKAIIVVFTEIDSLSHLSGCDV